MASNQKSNEGIVSPQELAREAANLALEKKAEDVVILDLRRFSLDCDFFLIASGTSDPHVRAIAEWVEDELQRRCGERPWHREGMSAARWILLDYVDVVVHVFLDEVRENYMLERLWGDAPTERFPAAEEQAGGTSRGSGSDQPTGAGGEG